MISDLPKATLLIIVAVLLQCSAAHACSCAMRPLAERFEEATYVFSAEIVEARLMVEPDAKYRASTDQVEIRIGPHKDHKADSSNIEFLYTNVPGPSCGLPVVVGASYTFFVNEDAKVDLCGSVVADDENEEFYYLLLDHYGLKEE